MALKGCLPGEKEIVDNEPIEKAEKFYGRTPEEQEEIKKLQSETFFTENEMEMINILRSLIIPANLKTGGALEAEVPEFIEFMAKDMPECQTLLRGGLMWLDHESNTDFGSGFILAPVSKQKDLLDRIAFYDPEIPMNERPLQIRFFCLVRNLTVTGYYTSRIGIEDLGYQGNTPNVWDGVPQEVLDKHGLSYDQEWLDKCIDQSKRADIAKWDDDGNLIT
jgi:hypothetical protein